MNGLRACIDKGFFHFFAESDADLFCVQETKMVQSQFIHSVPDYFMYWHSAQKKGYAGTAVFSRKAANDVVYGIDGLFVEEGRVITLTYDDFYVINCYSPHSQRDLNRLEYKTRFDVALAEYIGRLNMVKPVILCGDLNIAHKEIDLKNSKSNVGNAGFTWPEREDFDRLLMQGFIDSYRYQHPTQAGAYTWWSYRKGVRARNIGWRIDYILLSHKLKDRLVDSFIFPEVVGSDHCPIGIEITL